MKPEPLDLIKWMNKRIRDYEKKGNIDKRDTAVRFKNKVLSSIKSACEFYLQELDEIEYYHPDDDGGILLRKDDVKRVFKLAFSDIFEKEKERD